VEAHPDATAAELHAGVTLALDGFMEGAVQGDDVTLVVLQYCPVEEKLAAIDAPGAR
jgi:hypothetical protein